MRRFHALFTAVAAALTLAACQPAQAPAPDDEAAPVPEQTDEPALETASVGPLEFGYDPERLAAVDAQISLPRDHDRRISATKLIARDREPLMGREECMYGEAGFAMECTPESEGGIAFAMLDMPFEEARERLEGEMSEAVTLAGREGVRWRNGAAGQHVDYTLLPAGEGGALLIAERERARDNPDPDAIRQVWRNLSFRDGA